MGIRMDKPPVEMSLKTLVEYCKREMARYRRKETCDDQYCLEILRRAIMHRDDEAWMALQQLFCESLYIWLSRHPHRETALRYEPDEKNYVDDAFARFWRAVSEQKLTFTTLAAALSYLHLCLNCAIMDTLRAYSRPKEEPIPDYGHPDEPLVEDHYYENELWEVVKSILPAEREKRIAYLHFHCNLKPREIIRYCPSEFSSEDEIYRLKRNIMERILRNADKIRWRLSSDG
ncbi:sigma-70 family RNA polymerase sigma factor [Ktedonosporobacter rubrisoli]|uniref:Sigma-70 family RNA polymerase sigma factor n=1 Tax=Ktedonosporobacter rubrisoli TaxID=2509675 RepID=A0A4P6K0U4_KTERU|nr:sigma-70 family RNA polymerase sigma factor [Ktedonosporobacter rubrisoli]QBD81433.1 sigma-70 family RNA polymerase sigma factor [Ktedonosporobacter rubrisoli]